MKYGVGLRHTVNMGDYNSLSVSVYVEDEDSEVRASGNRKAFGEFVKGVSAAARRQIRREFEKAYEEWKEM